MRTYRILLAVAGVTLAVAACNEDAGVNEQATGGSAAGGGDGEGDGGLADSVGGGAAGESGGRPGAGQPCGTESGTGCAEESARVDLYDPSFSNPTRITNPLFPISELHSAVLLGTVDGLPFRAETTLLAGSKTIIWNGKTFEALQSQYAAFLDGRIHEIAVDWYAQDDTGAVWYLGEDVFNYEDGEVADKDGTWLAGRDGPAAMIMPAEPRVGNVYRPENSPGFVFEEVTVKAVGVRVEGPSGPVDDAVLVEELHLEGEIEEKIFAPGYGEFASGTDAGGDTELLAVAVPTDGVLGGVLTELSALRDATEEVFHLAGMDDWEAVTSREATIGSAWVEHRARGVPPLLEQQMDEALAALAAAIAREGSSETRAAALRVARAALDFELRYRTVVEVDLGRLDLWAAQVVLDAEAEDGAGLAGDVTSLDWVFARVAHTLDAGTGQEIEASFDELRLALEERDFSGASEVAGGLRAMLAEL